MAHTGEKWSMTFLWAAQKEKSEISPSPRLLFITERREKRERLLSFISALSSPRQKESHENCHRRFVFCVASLTRAELIK